MAQYLWLKEKNTFMLRYTRLFSVCAAMLLLAATACNSSTKTNQCAAVICTAYFASVGVHVVDVSGTPYSLDETYTLNAATGERMSPGQYSSTSGYFIILDDMFRQYLQNRTATFTFVGKRNGVKVVSEPYTISGDCCHITKVSGKDTVVVY